MSAPGNAKQVLELCDAVLAMPESERGSFLACIEDRDAELAESVRSLLRAVEDSGSFLALDEDRDEP